MCLKIRRNIKNFKLPEIEKEKSVLKTIRIKLTSLNKIEELSKKSSISVNRIINECIEFALENMNDK